MIRTLLAMLLCLAGCGRDEPARIAVGAAAIMRHAMPELIARHHALTGTRVDVVYGASDGLASRATNGTALDALVLADPAALAEVAATPPQVIATSSLVLLGPAGAPHRFGTLRDEGVIAIGDPRSVPAGRYARAHLETLGIWDAVAPRLVYGGDVAGVVALAQRETAHVAIVYATDATSAAPLVVLDRALDGPRVEIAAARTTRAAHATAADDFVRFLAGAEARAILARHGFGEVVR